MLVSVFSSRGAKCHADGCVVHGASFDVAGERIVFF